MGSLWVVSREREAKVSGVVTHAVKYLPVDKRFVTVERSVGRRWPGHVANALQALRKECWIRRAESYGRGVTLRRKSALSLRL